MVKTEYFYARFDEEQSHVKLMTKEYEQRVINWGNLGHLLWIFLFVSLSSEIRMPLLSYDLLWEEGRVRVLPALDISQISLAENIKYAKAFFLGINSKHSFLTAFSYYSLILQLQALSLDFP